MVYSVLYHSIVRFPLVSLYSKSNISCLFSYGSVVTAKCLRQSSSTTTNSSKSALGPVGKVKDKAALVLSASAHHTPGGTVSAEKKEAYITTLGPGGGYGNPHPPPFYKCEVCRKKTAFYRLKCCRLVVCEGYGCSCDPADAAKGEKLQSRRRRGKVVLTGKEKLPEVKLEGSDLFLWAAVFVPCKTDVMHGEKNWSHLQYYFAPVDELMNPQVKVIRATVYDFRQHGRDARTLSVRDELLMRKQLC
ncbi:hypothetical protein HU200_066060 [Digitaria exilis]|uniref:Uncharacterized protein n=1 Tax=Digitaria exilis TaxID=1010633 RepID=A0A834ZX69_9POAL|nr:hypothetical protein HU200_066060 [Digitaria exilis]